MQKSRSASEHLIVGSNTFPLAIRRNAKARRYLLRLNPDFTVSLTVPRWGSITEGRAFLERNLSWLERAARRLEQRPRLAQEWREGTEIYWRGERVRIQVEQHGGAEDERCVRFADQTFELRDGSTDLRPHVENHIWNIARRELPPMVFSAAQEHGLAVTRVCVRNQRSRWGSCSRRGVISLNWRLLQAPVTVRDYLIVHELMHLRQMNHSNRFWAEVARAFPAYAEAEQWLSRHSHLLARG